MMNVLNTTFMALFFSTIAMGQDHGIPWGRWRNRTSLPYTRYHRCTCGGWFVFTLFQKKVIAFSRGEAAAFLLLVCVLWPVLLGQLGATFSLHLDAFP